MSISGNTTPKWYYREDTSNIQATVGSILSNVQCVSIEGGDAEAATEHVFPGNMEASQAIGGIVTPADVTIELLYTDVIAPEVPALKRATARSTPVHATVTPKNPEGEAQDGELEWTGVLKSVTPPKRDASTSAKTFVKLVFTPNGE